MINKHNLQHVARQSLRAGFVAGIYQCLNHAAEDKTARYISDQRLKHHRNTLPGPECQTAPPRLLADINAPAAAQAGTMPSSINGKTTTPVTTARQLIPLNAPVTENTVAGCPAASIKYPVHGLPKQHCGKDERAASKPLQFDGYSASGTAS